MRAESWDRYIYITWSRNNLIFLSLIFLSLIILHMNRDFGNYSNLL